MNLSAEREEYTAAVVADAVRDALLDLARWCREQAAEWVVQGSICAGAADACRAHGENRGLVLAAVEAERRAKAL